MLFVDEVKKNIFRENVVFGCLPIGNPLDLSYNMVAHIREADVIIVETHEQFSRLLTEFRQSFLSYGPMMNYGSILQTNADIYQYNLDSSPEKVLKVNEFVANNHRNKKILIVSDEGSSIFLEPGCTLKHELEYRKIPYQVISGPNSMVSTLVSSSKNTNEFYFGCVLSSIKKDKRKDIFEKIKSLNIPAIFLLTGRDARESVQDLYNVFENDYSAELSINLSMFSEKHIRGSFTKLLNYIDQNSERFSRDREKDKYSIIIYPLQQDDSHYVIHDSDPKNLMQTDDIK